MKIDCNVILDLIPLVKDEVASDKSKELVLMHIIECESCKAEYDTFENINIDEITLEDKKIVRRLKKSIYISQIILILIGSFIGIALTNSMNVFYNFLIMPIVGGVSVLALKKKFYLAPIIIFTITYLWQLFGQIIKGGIYKGIFYLPIFFSLIYSGLVLVGVIIAILLKFALKKEV